MALARGRQQHASPPWYWKLLPLGLAHYRKRASVNAVIQMFARPFIHGPAEPDITGGGPMSFQAPITISDAISRIRSHRLLLPAIQREFVWSPEKVEWLFDSLLQGYPVGSFLFWEVRDANVKTEYRYYEFLREYRERYRTHNPQFSTVGHSDFDAVLDGQQRLTSLYIGLTGTYAYKRPRVWWENTEKALPTRQLYLNVVDKAPEYDAEPGRLYEFSFLTIEEYRAEPSKWFLVGRMLERSDAYEFNRMLQVEHYQDNEFSARALARLHSVIHLERSINYYRIESSDMERALNVFVRVNSGGEQLNLSDMLMSTAIAHWKTDARKAILDLVDEIRGKGFFIDKDFVMKACLYLYSSDIRYSVANFTASRVKPFEDNWEAIQSTIGSVFDLVRDFGYNEKSLTSKNALLPIVYWVHHKGFAAGITSQVGLRQERDVLRKWLHVALLKGIVGTSADTMLAAIRRVFTSDFSAGYITAQLDSFPVQRIGEVVKAQGRDPQVTEEFIDELLYTSYGDKQAFTILALLAPNLDYKNGDFHQDHLHPESAFNRRKLSAANLSAEDIEFYSDDRNWNTILNLRNLDANENKSKQDVDLAAWVRIEAQRQNVSEEKFCADRQLPEPSLLSFKRFRDFIAERRRILGQEIRAILQ